MIHGMMVLHAINRQMSYHIFMNHWKAASNLCRRHERVKRMIYGKSHYKETQLR